jgi:regulatory protein
VGQIITQTAINELLFEDQLEAAFQKSLRFIAYKPRTNFDVRKKLIESGYPEEIVEIILQRLEEKGYINDHQFANNWSENKSLNKPRSKKLIRLELKQKSIDEEIIEEVVNRMDSDDELAIRAAEKYYRKLSNLEEITFRRRLTGFLLRRGFSYSVIKPIVDQFWEKTCQNTNENLNE